LYPFNKLLRYAGKNCTPSTSSCVMQERIVALQQGRVRDCHSYFAFEGYWIKYLL
jgi:hypothetical protein